MAVIRNIKLLESVGFLPYETVKDILAKVENPDQLRRIENQSPHLKGHTGDLWLKFIIRDFPVERKADPMWPDDPEGWFRIYEKYKKVHKTSLEGHGNILQAALAGLKEDKEKHTSQIVTAGQLPPSLRDVTKRSWGTRFRGPAKSSSSGANAMAKLKKEASKISSIRNSAPSFAGPATTRAPAAHANHANARREVVRKPASALPSDANANANATFRLKMASRPFKEAARAAAGSTKVPAAREQQKTPQALKRKRDETPERQTPANNAIATPVPKRNRPDGMPKSPSDSPAKGFPSPQSADELMDQLNTGEEERLQQERAKPPRKKKPVNVFMNPKKRVH
ncbi:Elongin-A [Escovopsis weberi]|uniref:Elongin-A n=1 Tax=Escovopsis weberi TaxID=150374 RepID=A0A0M8N6L8_ESCWE|nr:Elongin-A [Escovopsis weberi]